MAALQHLRVRLLSVPRRFPSNIKSHGSPGGPIKRNPYGQVQRSHPSAQRSAMHYVVRFAALLMTNASPSNNLKETPSGKQPDSTGLGFNHCLASIGGHHHGISPRDSRIRAQPAPPSPRLYASGGTERAAALSGVPFQSVTVWVYASRQCASRAGSPFVLDTHVAAQRRPPMNSPPSPSYVIGSPPSPGAGGAVGGTLLGRSSSASLGLAAVSFRVFRLMQWSFMVPSSSRQVRLKYPQTAAARPSHPTPRLPLAPKGPGGPRRPETQVKNRSPPHQPLPAPPSRRCTSTSQ